MDESEKNGVIVDAKRRAKAHARATGESHQKSLDHVARLRGREDWSAFLADPVGEIGPSTPAWVKTIQRIHHKWPTATGAVGAVFMLLTMIVVNIEVAAFGGLISFHVPLAAALPFAIFWGAVIGWTAWMMIRESIRTLVLMRSGVVDSVRAMMLVYTILAPIILLEMWLGWTYAGTSTPLVVLILITCVIIYGVFFMGLPRKRRARNAESDVS